MTAAEEQQLLNNIAAISQDLKVLIGLIKDLIRQQDMASEKAHSQLLNIARKR